MSEAVKAAGKRTGRVEATPNGAYQSLVGGIAGVIDVNATMTAAYWLIGRHIVEFEQGGRDRGEYGRAVARRLGTDLSAPYGRGFSTCNLWQCSDKEEGVPWDQWTRA